MTTRRKHRPKLEDGERLVLTAVRTLKRVSGGNTPSLSELAEATGYSIASVHRKLSVIAQKGYVVRNNKSRSIQVIA